MKANELRVNNLVYDNESQDVIKIERGEHIEYTQFYEPIPLTEEWLLKFGFKELKRFTHDFEEVIYGKSLIKHDPNHSEKIVISLPFNHLYIGEFEIEEYYLADIIVNYVHQLQNLYFALTGEELTIKE